MRAPNASDLLDGPLPTSALPLDDYAQCSMENIGSVDDVEGRLYQLGMRVHRQPNPSICNPLAAALADSAARVAQAWPRRGRPDPVRAGCMLGGHLRLEVTSAAIPASQTDCSCSCSAPVAWQSCASGSGTPREAAGGSQRVKIDMVALGFRSGEVELLFNFHCGGIPLALPLPGREKEVQQPVTCMCFYPPAPGAPVWLLAVGYSGSEGRLRVLDLTDLVSRVTSASQSGVPALRPTELGALATSVHERTKRLGFPIFHVQPHYIRKASNLSGFGIAGCPLFLVAGAQPLTPEPRSPELMLVTCRAAQGVMMGWGGVALTEHPVRVDLTSVYTDLFGPRMDRTVQPLHMFGTWRAIVTQPPPLPDRHSPAAPAPVRSSSGLSSSAAAAAAAVGAAPAGKGSILQRTGSLKPGAQPSDSGALEVSEEEAAAAVQADGMHEILAVVALDDVHVVRVVHREEPRSGATIVRFSRLFSLGIGQGQWGAGACAAWRPRTRLMEDVFELLPPSGEARQRVPQLPTGLPSTCTLHSNMLAAAWGSKVYIMSIPCQVQVSCKVVVPASHTTSSSTHSSAAGASSQHSAAPEDRSAPSSSAAAAHAPAASGGAADTAAPPPPAVTVPMYLQPKLLHTIELEGDEVAVHLAWLDMGRGKCWISVVALPGQAAGDGPGPDEAHASIAMPTLYLFDPDTGERKEILELGVVLPMDGWLLPSLRGMNTKCGAAAVSLGQRLADALNAAGLTGAVTPTEPPALATCSCVHVQSFSVLMGEAVLGVVPEVSMQGVVLKMHHAVCMSWETQADVLEAIAERDEDPCSRYELCVHTAATHLLHVLRARPGAEAAPQAPGALMLMLRIAKQLQGFANAVAAESNRLLKLAAPEGSTKGHSWRPGTPSELAGSPVERLIAHASLLITLAALLCAQAQPSSSDGGLAGGVATGHEFSDCLEGTYRTLCSAGLAPTVVLALSAVLCSGQILLHPPLGLMESAIELCLGPAQEHAGSAAASASLSADFHSAKAAEPASSPAAATPADAGARTARDDEGLVGEAAMRERLRSGSVGMSALCKGLQPVGVEDAMKWSRRRAWLEVLALHVFDPTQVDVNRLVSKCREAHLWTALIHIGSLIGQQLLPAIDMVCYATSHLAPHGCPEEALSVGCQLLCYIRACLHRQPYPPVGAALAPLCGSGAAGAGAAEVALSGSMLEAGQVSLVALVVLADVDFLATQAPDAGASVALEDPHPVLRFLLRVDAFAVIDMFDTLDLLAPTTYYGTDDLAAQLEALRIRELSALAPQPVLSLRQAVLDCFTCILQEGVSALKAPSLAPLSRTLSLASQHSDSFPPVATPPDLSRHPSRAASPAPMPLPATPGTPFTIPPAFIRFPSSINSPAPAALDTVRVLLFVGRHAARAPPAALHRPFALKCMRQLCGAWGPEEDPGTRRVLLLCFSGTMDLRPAAGQAPGGWDVAAECRGVLDAMRGQALWEPAARLSERLGLESEHFHCDVQSVVQLTRLCRQLSDALADSERAGAGSPRDAEIASARAAQLQHRWGSWFLHPDAATAAYGLGPAAGAGGFPPAVASRGHGTLVAWVAWAEVRFKQLMERWGRRLGGLQARGGGRSHAERDVALVETMKADVVTLCSLASDIQGLAGGKGDGLATSLAQLLLTCLSEQQLRELALADVWDLKGETRHLHALLQPIFAGTCADAGPQGVPGQVTNKGLALKRDPKVTQLYMRLCCQFDEASLMHYLRTLNTVPDEQTVDFIRKYNLLHALAFVLFQQGHHVEALRVALRHLAAALAQLRAWCTAAVADLVRRQLHPAGAPAAAASHAARQHTPATALRAGGGALHAGDAAAAVRAAVTPVLDVVGSCARVVMRLQRGPRTAVARDCAADGAKFPEGLLLSAHSRAEGMQAATRVADAVAMAQGMLVGVGGSERGDVEDGASGDVLVGASARRGWSDLLMVLLTESASARSCAEAAAAALQACARQAAADHIGRAHCQREGGGQREQPGTHTGTKHTDGQSGDAPGAGQGGGGDHESACEAAGIQDEGQVRPAQGPSTSSVPDCDVDRAPSLTASLLIAPAAIAPPDPPQAAVASNSTQPSQPGHMQEAAVSSSPAQGVAPVAGGVGEPADCDLDLSPAVPAGPTSTPPRPRAHPAQKPRSSVPAGDCVIADPGLVQALQCLWGLWDVAMDRVCSTLMRRVLTGGSLLRQQCIDDVLAETQAYVCSSEQRSDSTIWLDAWEQWNRQEVLHECVFASRDVVWDLSMRSAMSVQRAENAELLLWRSLKELVAEECLLWQDQWLQAMHTPTLLDVNGNPWPV